MYDKQPWVIEEKLDRCRYFPRPQVGSAFNTPTQMISVMAECDRLLSRYNEKWIQMNDDEKYKSYKTKKPESLVRRIIFGIRTTFSEKKSSQDWEYMSTFFLKTSCLITIWVQDCPNGNEIIKLYSIRFQNFWIITKNIYFFFIFSLQRYNKMIFQNIVTI